MSKNNNNDNLNNKETQTKLISVVEKICDRLRTVMEVNEYRNYVLGFLFYKYLSEKIEEVANDHLESANIKYRDFNPKSENYNDIRKYIIDNDIGFYIDYNLTFRNVLEQLNQGKRIIPIIEKAFHKIEESSVGSASEGDFKGLFQDVKLDDTKLGKIEEQREETVKFIVKEISFLNLSFEDVENDVFGGAYEYLLSEFASDGGKKAGEFYTPTSVAELIAKIATHQRKYFVSAYDPACGSGSLLIKLTKKVNRNFDKVYGQEVKASTFNLTRMNLFLRGMNYSNFDIKEGDTLISPKHLGLEFDCIVANPPFSLKWNPSPKLHQDERYNPYPKLAPKSYADFAFLQHMLHHVKQEGGIIVSVFSLGILERGNAEKDIRKYIVDRNYIDSIIMLPPKMFFNTSIPTCILVARKDKKNSNVFFIDGSSQFQVGKRQNSLSDENISTIFETWKNKTEVAHFSKLVSRSTIIENDYSLSVSKYIKPKDVEIEVVDINQVNKELAEIDSKIQELKNKFEENLKIYMEKNSKNW